MRQDVHDTLTSQCSTYSIVHQLHNVPPHEVYEVTVNGKRAVYKGDTGVTGSAGTEGRVIKFVGEQTSVPVPEILLVGDDYYVAAWHPNAPDPDETHDATETWADAAGRGLATLHDETDPLIDGYGYFRPREDSVTTGADDWHTAAVAYVRHHRPALIRYGHADIADAVIDFFNDNPGIFAGADGPVCCHGWATPEHVAVIDDRVGCIVDFEHAIAAPGEFDYWRTVMPTFRHEATQKQAFREGYESVRSLPSGLDRRKPLYVILNFIYYFESLYVQDQHGPEETAKRTEWLRDSVTETLESLS